MAEFCLDMVLEVQMSSFDQRQHVSSRSWSKSLWHVSVMQNDCCCLCVRISFRKLKDLDESERRRQDELDVKTLQILRALVHNEIMNIDPQLHEDDPASYRRRCTNKVQPLQNKLQGFGNAMSRVSICERESIY